MRWTAVGGGLAMVLALAGCVYGYRTIAAGARYSTASRPDASYFCYDCHGYRYFDPYYDWCPPRGFHYRWADHPSVIGLYRTRYVRIRETHPEYGRHRYRAGYRTTARYRTARDYESWRRDEARERLTERKARTKKTPGQPSKNAPKDRNDKQRPEGRRTPSRQGG